MGRDINELRRKTKNESLAKRAKELVKRWRDLILKQSEAEASQQNGGRSIGKRPISPATSVANSDDRSSPGLPEAVPRTHASNKRLRKANPESLLVNGGSPETSEPVVTPSPSSNKRDIVKEKIARIARVPKVKTTQELVAGLRGEKPVTVSADLAKNKTEHIARFLRSEPEEEDAAVDVEEDGVAPAVSANRRFTPPDEILARLPPLDTSNIVWSDPESPASPSPVCPDSLIEERIDGINCNFADPSDPSSFVEFHQVLTRTLSNGDLIHVLPYVIID